MYATASMRAQCFTQMTMSDVLKCREIGIQTISIDVIDKRFIETKLSLIIDHNGFGMIP